MTNNCLLYAILFINLWSISATKRSTREKHDFLKLSQTAAFVDKTLLIKAILQPGRRLLITAPPKFGKSTNLQMIKTFFSFISLKEVQKVRDIFTNLRIYKDEQTLFDNNFAKWPVLFVNLSTKTIILSLEDALEELKLSIHRTYKEHNYLLKSTNLDEYDKCTCRNWITEYKNMQECDITLGLPDLARYLHKHFKKSVIVLVDGYDDIINTAMSRVVDDLSFERIVTLVSNVLEKATDSRSIKLELAVLTGVSYTGERMDCVYLDGFPFLNNHKFAPFYGFSLEEVNSVFNRMAVQLNETKRDEAIQFYNGYNSKGGLTLFNPSSIRQFLKNGRITNYLDPSIFVEKTYYLLQFPIIEDCFNNLLSGDTIKATIYKSISNSKLIDLKDLYQRMVDDSPDVNLFLSHLMGFGYLSYALPQSGSKQFNEVKLPNKEIKQSLLGAYKRYYTEAYGLNTTLVEGLGYVAFKTALMDCKDYSDKLNYEKSLKMSKITSSH